MAGALVEDDIRLAADPKLKRLLDALVSDVDPIAIWLFGSRARGEERPDSDYDLLVVFPDHASGKHMDPGALAEVAWRARVGADVIPCHRSAFEQSRDLVGTLSYEAAHFGKCVYAR
jgi:uncharacterized protein